MRRPREKGLPGAPVSFFKPSHRGKVPRGPPPQSLPPGGKVPPKGADEGAPLKAFPLGGRWHGEAVTDEGAMIEKFRSLQGSFAAPAASDFLDAQKVTKKAPGGGRNRRFGRASRLHASRPLEPPFTGVTPWTRQNISGAQNLSGWSQFPPGHWALGLWKIGAGAAPFLRLALPSQHVRFNTRNTSSAPFGGTFP